MDLCTRYLFLRHIGSNTGSGARSLSECVTDFTILHLSRSMTLFLAFSTVSILVYFWVNNRVLSLVSFSPKFPSTLSKGWEFCFQIYPLYSMNYVCWMFVSLVGPWLIIICLVCYQPQRMLVWIINMGSISTLVILNLILDRVIFILELELFNGNCFNPCNVIQGRDASIFAQFLSISWCFLHINVHYIWHPEITLTCHHNIIEYINTYIS